MRAPETSVVLEDGSTSPLSDLYRARPLVLVFLRHSGCVFCRYHVAQLRTCADLNLCFVCMETPAEAAAFKAEMRSPHRFISDPERALYEAFGLQRGGFTQVFNLRTFRRGVEAMRQGHLNRKPTSDPWQLAGTFIVDTDGEVVWNRQARDAADVATAAEIRERLAGIGKTKARVGGEE